VRQLGHDVGALVRVGIHFNLQTGEQVRSSALEYRQDIKRLTTICPQGRASSFKCIVSARPGPARCSQKAMHFVSLTRRLQGAEKWFRVSTRKASAKIDGRVSCSGDSKCTLIDLSETYRSTGSTLHRSPIPAFPGLYGVFSEPSLQGRIFGFIFSCGT
jgi:hypothetical protein